MSAAGREPARGESAALKRAIRMRKRVGLALVAVPFALFTLFAVGEGSAGDAGWWVHLLQVAGMALLLGLAWSRPHIGGPVLVAVGLVLSAILIAGVRDDLWSRLLSASLLFAPLIAGGVAFTRAGSYARSASSAASRSPT